MYYLQGVAHLPHPHSAASRRALAPQHASLLQNLPCVIYSRDVHVPWRTTFISHTVYDLIGVSAEAFLAGAITWANVVFPSDLPLLEAAFQHSLRHKTPYALEYRVFHSGGALRWVHEVGRPIFDPQGLPLRLEGCIFDVTTRRRQEQRLACCHDILCALLADAPCDDALSLIGRVVEAEEPTHRCVIQRRDAPARPPPADKTNVTSLHILSEEQASLGVCSIYYPANDTFSVTDIERLQWATSCAQRVIAHHHQAAAARERDHFNLLTLDALDANIAVVSPEGQILSTNRAWRSFAQANGGDSRCLSEGANYITACANPARTTTGALDSSHTDAALVSDAIRAISEGRLSTFTHTYPCHSPTVQRWFQCFISSFPGPRPCNVVVSHTDITPIKRAEQAVTLLRRRFSDLFEMSTDAILIINDRGVIVQANSYTESLLGWSLADLIGVSVSALIPLEAHALHTSYIKQYFAHPHPRKMTNPRTDIQAIHRDGSSLFVDISISPIHDDDTPLAAVTIRDITERRKLEQQNLRSQRLEAIGTLASGLAHDLNNALSPITMGLEILEDEVVEEVDLLETMRASARRCADLVRQVLTFSRGAEGARVRIQPFALLTEIKALLVATFPKNIDLRFLFARSLPYISCDVTQIHQILLNLCVNARDAMSPNGGTLTLEACAIDLDAAAALAIPDGSPGQYLLLSVQDTGSGIPAALLDRIFEPFFTTKDAQHGTGLGLSTVAGLVRSHAGFIDVQSQPSVHTAFNVYLPLPNEFSRADHPSALQHPPPPLLQGHGERVLFVDDEPRVCTLAHELLLRLRYQPTITTSSAEALTLARTQSPCFSVVITNLNMPHLDGIALIDALRQDHPDLPIILMSGHFNDAPSTYLAGGVSACLQKPFTQLELGAALHAATQLTTPSP
jgi:PAS domain S-box-containing protein